MRPYGLGARLVAKPLRVKNQRNGANGTAILGSARLNEGSSDPLRVTSAHFPGLSASPAAAAATAVAVAATAAPFLAPSFPVPSPLPSLALLCTAERETLVSALPGCPRAALGTRATCGPTWASSLFPICWRGSPLSSLLPSLSPSSQNWGLSGEIGPWARGSHGSHFLHQSG